MTLNTHSLVERDYEEKLRQFVRGVLAEGPDVIALEEVNQTIAAPPADDELLCGYVPAQESVPIRADNHAARTARLLREAGVTYSWTYLPVKVGYGKYDEGLALLSRERGISRVESCLISRTDDYTCWKTRRALAMQPEGMRDWFCAVHMGWWADAQEPFLAQWEALRGFLAERARHAPVWLMGDFNAPAEVRGEGYDRIAADGWHDTYVLARLRGEGATVPGAIDGWRDGKTAAGGMRIDQIWCSQAAEIAESCVVFDGREHPVVSDHFGVMIRGLPPGCAGREEDA